MQKIHKVVIRSYAKNKTFIGISSINLIYPWLKSAKYYKKYSEILSWIRAIGINKNVVRTYRIDQFEQQEIMQLYKTKHKFFDGIYYFYSIDVPPFEYIEYDDKSEKFNNPYVSILTQDINISCKMLSLPVKEIKFAKIYIKKINMYLLHRTRMLEILFNTSDFSGSARLTEDINEICEAFHNIKHLNYNVFDSFDILQKVFKVQTSKTKSIEFTTIKLKDIHKSIFSLKLLDWPLIVADSQIGFTKYSWKFLSIIFYDFNIGYIKDGHLVLNNFYSLTAKEFDYCDHMDMLCIQDTNEVANQDTDLVGLKNDTPANQAEESKSEGLQVSIPLEKWKSGKICVSEVNEGYRQTAEQFLSEIISSSQLRIDHRSQIKF